MPFAKKLVEIEDFLLKLNDSEKTIFGRVVLRMSECAIGTNKREVLEARMQDDDAAALASVKRKQGERQP